MDRKVTGVILEIFDTKEHKNDFKTREVVVKTEEQYPQELLFQFVNKMCAVMDNYAIGQVVEISFNLRGSSWTQQDGTKRWFNTLQGWRIEGQNSGGGQPNNNDDPFA